MKTDAIVPSRGKFHATNNRLCFPPILSFHSTHTFN